MSNCARLTSGERTCAERREGRAASGRGAPHACNAEHAGYRHHGRSGLQSLERLNSWSEATI
jgi:hypothetical protein